jgi:hypothetical protein
MFDDLDAVVGRRVADVHDVRRRRRRAAGEKEDEGKSSEDCERLSDHSGSSFDDAKQNSGRLPPPPRQLR